MNGSVRLLLGANPYAERSVVAVRAPLPESEQARSFLQRLFDQTRDFFCHRDCGATPELQALRENQDTPLPLLAAAVAVRLLRKHGIEVSRCGLTEDKGEEAWLEMSDALQTRLLAMAIFEAAQEVGDRQEAADENEIDEHVQSAFELIREHTPEHFSQLTIAAIERRGLPWRFRGTREEERFEVGVGARARWFYQSFFEREGQQSFALVRDKTGTAQFLDRYGITTPRQRSCDSGEDISAAVRDLGFPLVTKPRFGGGGAGVVVDIRDAETLQRGVRFAMSVAKPVVLERFVPGRDYRFLVIGGRFFGCAWRRPATVFGDGTRTISELCQAENAKPERGDNRRFTDRTIPLAQLDQKLTTPYRTLEMARNLDRREDLPQVTGNRIETQQNVQPVSIQITRGQDGVFALRNRLVAKIDVPIEQPSHGQAEVLLGETCQRQHGTFRLAQSLVEVAQDMSTTIGHEKRRKGQLTPCCYGSQPLSPRGLA